MIGHAAEGGGELQAQLAGLGVGQAVQILEHAVQEVVHVRVADVVPGDDHGAHGHGGDVLGGAVHVGGDDGLGVEGGLGHQLVDVLLVQAHQIHGVGGGQGGHGVGGSAGHHEGGVDLAVLQGLGALVKGLVGGTDVVLGQAVDVQDVDGVEVHAGARRADGHALARQIRHGLDLGIQGDDLDLLHVQRRHDGEIGDGAGVGKGAGAGVGIGEHVRLGKG